MQLAGVRDDPRVGAEDPGDVGIDLAVTRGQGGREGHGCCVGAAAAERRDVEVRRDALKAGDQHDLALVERLVDPARPDVDDLRLAVDGVGDDPGLAAGERDRLVAEIVDRHRGQGTGDSLPDGNQHVELTRLRGGRDLVGEANELVGRVAHRREDGDDACPPPVGGHDPCGNILQLLRVADGRAAELHHDGAGAGGRVAGDGGYSFELGDRHAVKSRQTPLDRLRRVTVDGKSQSWCSCHVCWRQFGWTVHYELPPAVAATPARTSRCRHGSLRRRPTPIRYEWRMRYRQLGSSDLQVSEISLGSWLTYGVGVENDAARAWLDRAFEVGMNLIDTSNVYGRGAAEEFLGDALKDRPRDSYVLATKLFFPMDDTGENQ